MSKLKLQPRAAANKTTYRDPSAIRLLWNVIEAACSGTSWEARSPRYVRVGPSAFEQVELLLNLGDLCVARGGRFFASSPRDVRSVQITDEIATPASIVRESFGFEISFSAGLLRNFGEFVRAGGLPGSPDRFVRLGHLQKTLVALGDGVNVGSHRGWLAGRRCQRHRIVVSAELAGG